MIRTSIGILFSLSLLTACTGGSGDAENDASTVVGDADPNAPDADPNAPDGGNGSDGGQGVTDASVSTPDAGAAVGVECGKETCTLGTEECCIMGIGSFSCVAAGTCNGTATTCDGPEDCNGDVCCGGFGGASCENTCEGNSGELCHTPTDCTVPGDMCCEFGPLSVCAPNCQGGGLP